MKIILYDAMSYLRLRLETEKGPFLVRGVLNETQLPGVRIWVWDGVGGNSRRRKIFPAYKTSRVHKPGVIQAMDYFRELLALTPTWQIRMPGWEGDDVIAALTKHFLATTQSPIHIDCRDADLAALCALSPRVTCSHMPKELKATDIRLYKLCVGDPSDDIPGIKGFGKGGWEKADKASLRRLVGKILDREEWSDGEATACGLRPTSINWLRDERNVDELAVMRRIIDPIDIPYADLTAALQRGVYDPARLHAKLEQFYL